MPLRTNANTFMTLESSKDFATLPIPEPTLTLTISRHDKASIRRKIDLASISSNDMSSKPGAEPRVPQEVQVNPLKF
jgi:hypothetical protein